MDFYLFILQYIYIYIYSYMIRKSQIQMACEFNLIVM